MLSDVACRNARPRDREYKISDAHGLYLLVKPSGYRVWRWKYRYHGREKQLVIGPYPEVSLAIARQERDRARTALREGRDPSAEKKLRKAEAKRNVLDSFERIARAWHSQRSATLSDKYARQVLRRLEQHVFRQLGSVPIRAITPPMVLDVLREVEGSGTREMPHRVRMHISDIFVWAIASGLAESDPAAIVAKALKPRDSSLRPAVLKIEEARQVLKDVEAVEDAYWGALLASRLLALTAVRPGVVQFAERSEFEGLDGPDDADQPRWRIPASKMKLSRERKRDASFQFIVPLSRQAADVVRVAMRASRSPRWIFPGMDRWRQPLSTSTVRALYRKAHLAGRHVPHGWRSSFSTIMNERAAIENREGDRAVIDMMLAHMRGDVEAAYNRAAYMPRRRELAQAWADMLMEGLKPPAELVPAALR